MSHETTVLFIEYHEEGTAHILTISDSLYLAHKQLGFRSYCTHESKKKQNIVLTMHEENCRVHESSINMVKIEKLLHNL